MGTELAAPIRQPLAGAVPLARALDAMVREGELYGKLDGRRVRCYACAHRCVIPDGARGICQVRYNRGGKLFVPYGYVSSLNPDPTEKKPFFHVLPGSITLTFGMLGCDLHCANCFTGDVRVVTSRGVLALKDVFTLGERVQRTRDAEIAYPADLKTIAASGTWRAVRKVFKHHYAGPLTVVRPFYLPELRCTPDHRVYATLDPNDPPQVTEARALTTAHYLTIPKHYAFSEPQVVDVDAALRQFEAIYQVPHDLDANDIREIAVATSKSSVALLFQSLSGVKANGKHVPPQLFDAPRDVVESFLSAYIEGDGHHYPNGKVSVTTTSADLAYGVAYLALKLGYLASLYENALPQEKRIQGRSVKPAEQQFTVVWYTDSTIRRRCHETEDYYLVPLRAITTENFDGDVYNMEVDEEHNYLANFFLVKNCQNWEISQALRDADAGSLPQRVSPEQIVAIARRTGAQLIGSSYNEPLITSEWAIEIFKLAQQRGIRGIYVSNGNATREVLEALRPYLVGYKIDLKTMQDRQYRKLGAPLQNILDAIKMAKGMGFWVEVVTLVIPGFNDSNEELMDAAQFIRSVSPDIPWHVTAFHPEYKMTDADYTPVSTLIRAAEIGQEAGLNYVYAGNVPGRVKSYENTYCPKCNTLLVERYAYQILQDRLTGRGACPKCGEVIAGIWV